MNTYDELKNELLNVADAFADLFEKAEGLAGHSEDSFSNWKNTCAVIRKQISEDIVRVAVVGPIKSGKSTFVNSLFQNDYLKRGAGVITSIVTRIRCGENLKAVLFFKSWDEINKDIEQGLSLLPSWTADTDDFRFDLRKETHRKNLEQALTSLSTDQLITNDTRNINIVLLTSYLKGYEQVKDIIMPDVVVKHYEGDDFAEHRIFAGDEVMAVYLKDIQLEINSEVWDGSIEIADCQGSDSPNPLHLALIQDYLSLTNFIVYVVSSRTGLRRADIRFLSMIKDMGITENMFFVVNCDFSEHESFDEFNQLMVKIREDLSLIITDPEIFTLSALFNLFSVRRELKDGAQLSPKDVVRLEQWEAEDAFAELSRKETLRLETVLNDKLTRERYSLLLKNHIERISLITSGLSQWVALNKEILNRDSVSANEMISRIHGSQEKTNKVSKMIRSTLDGSVKRVTSDLRGDVDQFFDERSGEIISEIKKFIKNYEVNFERYSEESESSAFTTSLYAVYQDFKQGLDTFMTESITPKTIGFMKKVDEKILADLEQMTKPYANMVENAIAEYENTLNDFGIVLEAPETSINERISDLETLKSMSRLKYSPATAVMSYSARVRAETLVRFGFYNVFSYIKKIFIKQPHDKKNDEMNALKGGLGRMKQETVSNIISHFKSYRENIKFQYFFKLADAVAEAFYELYTERFQAYVTDLEFIADLINKKKLDKDNVLIEIETLEGMICEMHGRISTIKDKISLI